MPENKPQLCVSGCSGCCINYRARDNSFGEKYNLNQESQSFMIRFFNQEMCLFIRLLSCNKHVVRTHFYISISNPYRRCNIWNPKNLKTLILHKLEGA